LTGLMYIFAEVWITNVIRPGATTAFSYYWRRQRVLGFVYLLT